MMKMFPAWGKSAAIVLALAAMLAAAGCTTGGNVLPEKPSPSSEQKSPTEKDAPQPKEVTINIYYPNEDGSKLVAVRRKLEPNETKNKYYAAVESIMADADGQFTVIPRKTRLNSVKVNDGIAQVDFTADLTRNFVGGSTGEEMLVGSVVNTLTEFPEVRAVEFYIDGKKIDTVSGHSDLSEPVKRMEELLK